MKSHLLSILFVVILACLLFVSCDPEADHIHRFILEDAEEQYLYSAATCTQRAVYFKHCTCGAHLDETFEYGDLLPHSYVEVKVEAACLKSEASCASPAVYYKSCVCGEKGTETFEYGNLLPHSYTEVKAEASYLKSEASCTSPAVYYKSCVCGEKGTETFTFGTQGSHNYEEGKCTVCNAYKDYRIGSVGPAGGYIFYDADADNTEDDPDGSDDLLSSVCGWRYLEAATEDIVKGEVSTFGFGFKRQSYDGYNQYSSGMTQKEIGKGEANTKELVKCFGAETYVYDRDHAEADLESAYYAAKLCADDEEGDHDDWFLPSAGELFKMMTVLGGMDLGGFDAESSYWTSSEDSASYAWCVKLGNSSDSTTNRQSRLKVRAIRSF